MTMLNDPEMKDVVLDFCRESEQIFEELQNYLEDFEDNPAELELLENFGQAIDRVMGAAKSLGAAKVGSFCELGKTIAYKASQSQDENLIQIVVAVLFDTVDILGALVKNIKEKQKESVENISLETFSTRLKWLAEKFQDITRSSVAVNDQKSIDELLKDLGL